VVHSISAIEAEILTAFANVRAPGRVDVADPSDWDADSIAEDFSQWLERPVPSWLLEKHAKSLPALTPRAFVFFLKDYLLYSLAHPNSELTEHLIYRLSSAKKDDPYWTPRLDLLSTKQIKAVAMSCEFFKEQLPAVEVVLRQKSDEAMEAWAMA
jgi:hypothetical protein